MRARAYLIAGVAVIALAAGSVAALAATHTGPAAAPTGCTVPSVAGQQVRVVLADMGGGPMMGGGSRNGRGSRAAGRMMMAVAPSRVSAGTVGFLAVNHGTRTHELVVLPLPDGASVGTRAVGADGTVDETGSLGEASRGCGAGIGDGIAPGQLGWVTLPLSPGRYELLCNLPGHYAAGMYAELDVG